MVLLKRFLFTLALCVAACFAELELVTDDLPTIDVLLEELEMTHLAEKFYSSGFTETRYILRMKDMDMRIMASEWGVDAKSIQKVRDAIKNYKVEREVIKVVEDPLVALRNSLTYGKLVVNRSTTSYEYFTAYFSAPLPRKFLALQFSSDELGCSKLEKETMVNKVLVATRGECSFLEKATNASVANASALVVINNSTELFQIAAGYATGSHLEEDVGVPKDLPVILIKQHAKMALQLAAQQGLEARMVPLRCASGESGCFPVLPEEQDIVYEIDSGLLNIKDAQYEFVSGTWGGILPLGPLRIVEAEPFNACGPLTNDKESLEGAVVLVARGVCGFGDKALNIQSAGGAVMLVADRPHSALLRMGATQDQMNEIGIPGIMVTHKSAEKLRASLQTGFATIDPLAGMSLHWQELEMASWPEKDSAFDVMYHQLMGRNEDSAERSEWLKTVRNMRYGIKIDDSKSEL